MNCLIDEIDERNVPKGEEKVLKKSKKSDLKLFDIFDPAQEAEEGSEKKTDETISVLPTAGTSKRKGTDITGKKRAKKRKIDVNLFATKHVIDGLDEAVRISASAKHDAILAVSNAAIQATMQRKNLMRNEQPRIVIKRMRAACNMITKQMFLLMVNEMLYVKLLRKNPAQAIESFPKCPIDLPLLTEFCKEHDREKDLKSGLFNIEKARKWLHKSYSADQADADDFKYEQRPSEILKDICADFRDGLRRYTPRQSPGVSPAYHKNRR